MTLAAFSDKDVIAQLIDPNKKLTYSRKTLTATIEILIQNETRKTGQANQTFQEKP